VGFPFPDKNGKARLIKTEIGTEQQQNENGHGKGKAPIVMDDISNPEKNGEIMYQPADITQRECPTHALAAQSE
jgi:hypothetical protein